MLHRVEEMRRLALCSLPILERFAEQGRALYAGLAADQTIADAVSKLEKASAAAGTPRSVRDGFRRLIWAPLARSALVMRSRPRSEGVSLLPTMAERPTDASLQSFLSVFPSVDKRFLGISVARHGGRDGADDYYRLTSWYVSLAR